MKFLIPLIFIAVPIAEIAAFIKVGNLIGLWPTLATIVVTAILGAALIRQQGLKTLAQAQSALNQGRAPIDSVADGIFLLVAAMLLLTPGFLTDALGFLLLWQPLRLSAAKWLWRRLQNLADVQIIHPDGSLETEARRPDSWHKQSKNHTAHGPVIEGEVIEPDAGTRDNAEPEPPHIKDGRRSPWRK